MSLHTITTPSATAPNTVRRLLAGTTPLLAWAALSACSTPGMPSSTAMAPPMFSQANLPDAVKVPAGHQVVMETSAAGEITYECRAKKDMASQFEWVFVGPEAGLKDRRGQNMGRYFGPPATWAHLDGSAVSGAQVAVAPAMAGSIPLQLVKANPAVGTGAMRGVSYIQRVNTQGGVAPAQVCDGQSLNRKQLVRYAADYIFWAPV